MEFPGSNSTAAHAGHATAWMGLVPDLGIRALAKVLNQGIYTLNHIRDPTIF